MIFLPHFLKKRQKRYIRLSLQFRTHLGQESPFTALEGRPVGLGFLVKARLKRRFFLPGRQGTRVEFHLKLLSSRVALADLRSNMTFLLQIDASVASLPPPLGQPKRVCWAAVFALQPVAKDGWVQNRTDSERLYYPCPASHTQEGTAGASSSGTV